MARKKMNQTEIAENLKSLKDWKAADEKLKKRFEFKNFAEALNFINKIGAIAEEKDHHPDITFGWGYAEIELTTHDASGLTHNDFDIAEKIDKI